MLSPASVPEKHISSETYDEFMKPLRAVLPDSPALVSRGDRPLKLTFGHHLKLTFGHQMNALIYYHLFEHESARDLIQNPREDDFAREHIAPEEGISRSSFSEAANHRGAEQLQYVFQEPCFLSRRIIPRQYADFGEVTLIDGSLTDAVLSMYRADYRKNSRKAKGHFGFDLSRGIPSAVFL
ncbi:MAG: IS4 family transposase, partial [Deltaproteobacteria bacterium]